MGQAFTAMPPGTSKPLDKLVGESADDAIGEEPCREKSTGARHDEDARHGFNRLLAESEEKLCGLIRGVLQEMRARHYAELEAAYALAPAPYAPKAKASPDVRVSNLSRKPAMKSSTTYKDSGVVLHWQDQEKDLSLATVDQIDSSEEDDESAKALQLADIWTRKPPSARYCKETQRDRPTSQYEIDIFEHTSYRGHHTRSIQKGCFLSQLSNPSSAFNTTWRFMALFLLGYDCMTVPMTVFDLPADSISMRTMMYIAVLFWTVDMPLSFFRGFINADGDLEIRLKQVVRNYLRTAFFQDLVLLIIEWVSFIHVVFIERPGFRSTSVMRVLKFMRLLKMTKANHLFSFFYRWLGSDFVLQMLSVPRVVICCFILHHLMACGWHAISGEDGDYQIRYAMALHWSCSQMGFGWVSSDPEHLGEHVYAIVVGVLCIMMLTVLIGAIVTEMARTEARLTTQRNQEVQLSRFLRMHQISWPLRNRIWTFLNKIRQEKKYIGQRSVDLIRTLPGAITLELQAESYIPVLTNHPFFGTYAVSGVTSYPMRLLFEQQAVNELAVVVEHELFMASTPATHMFFLVHGHLYYRATRGVRVSGRNSARGSINMMFAHNSGNHVQKSHQGKAATGMAGRVKKYFRTRPRSVVRPSIRSFGSRTSGIASRVLELGVGDWLCEAALWLQWCHAGIAAAKTDCELVSLEAQKFQDIMHTELPEALAYARLFARYAAENADFFDDAFKDDECLEDLAKEVFEPPLFFDIAGCRPAVDGARSEWHPTDRKQWSLVWTSRWKEGHLYNSSAMISTLTKDMKNDVVLLYQTMFTQNLSSAMQVHLKPEETVLHDQRVLFLKRLVLALAVCRLRFTSKDNGLTLQMWPYPLAAALCHGSRIMVHLSDVNWRSFVNLLLFGEEEAWSWEDNRVPTPFYCRRAASHGIRLDSNTSQLQETKLHGVAALGSCHLGMDLPLGGLGNPVPASSPAHGHMYVGHAGTPFRKNWMHKGTLDYLTNIQHGHLYMRWEEIGDATAVSLELDEAEKRSFQTDMERFRTGSSAKLTTRGSAAQILQTPSDPIDRSSSISSGPAMGASKSVVIRNARESNGFTWSSNLECWLPPSLHKGGDGWTPVPAVETKEEMRLVMRDKYDDLFDMAELHRLWAVDREFSVEVHTGGPLRCRGLLLQLSISQADGGEEKFLVQTGAVARLNKADELNKGTSWRVDEPCQMTLLCLCHEAWGKALRRYLTDVLGLGEQAVRLLLGALPSGEAPYIFKSGPVATVCHHHVSACPEGVEVIYDVLHLSVCLQPEDRQSFEPILGESFVTKESMDITGFGGCNVPEAQGNVFRDWKWVSSDEARELGLSLERPEDSCRLVLTEATKNVNALLIGIESSAPLKKDFFGHTHSVDAVSKSVSAFGKRKWRDYRSGGSHEVPADLGGMHVHVDQSKLERLREVLTTLKLCKPSDGHNHKVMKEVSLFQDLLQSSDEEVGDVLEEYFGLDREMEVVGSQQL